MKQGLSIKRKTFPTVSNSIQLAYRHQNEDVDSIIYMADIIKMTNILKIVNIINATDIIKIADVKELSRMDFLALS